MTTPRSVRRVAVLAPMRLELRPLIRSLSLEEGADATLAARVGDVEILATMTGIGPRRAARAAERVLDAGPFDHVVVVGVAGGIGPSVRIGDLVVPEIVVDLRTGAEHRPASSTWRGGILATTECLLTDRDEIGRLERRGIIAIDMETAAIAEVCERRGCPWSVYRAISDRADDGSIDEAVLGLTRNDGRPNLPAVARFVVRSPQRMPQLVRVARDFTLAANVAASAAVRALGEM